MKFEKEFRAAHPETIGEKDKSFDLLNYIHFLEGVVDSTLRPMITFTPKTYSGDGICNHCGANIKLPNKGYTLFDGTPCMFNLL